MKSFVILKEGEGKETALSIPHIQSIEKSEYGCTVHYLSPYVNEKTSLEFNLSVEEVVDAIHETLGRLEKQDEDNKNRCPSCGKPIKICKGKAGYYFIWCSGYPRCNWCTPVEA